MRVIVNCHAKLNLFLKVYGKRPDGFHDLISVMQSIDLSDRLLLEQTDAEGIEIVCSKPGVPTDATNLVWQAADILAKEAGKPVGGLKAVIEKDIPIMGGLAGGSADGAGALLGLNRLWTLGIDDTRLFEMAAQLGSDVPFCMLGGTALVRGRGESVEALPTGVAQRAMGSGAFLLILPPVNVDTKSAYNALDARREKQARKWGDLGEEYTQIREGWMSAIAGGTFPVMFYNDFEDAVFDEKPELRAIHTNLRNHAGHAILSGSGSGMFAWFDRTDDALEARERYTPIAGEVSLVSYPVDTGVTMAG